MARLPSNGDIGRALAPGCPPCCSRPLIIPGQRARRSAARPSRSLLVHQPSDQYFALTDMVGWPDYPFLFHLFDQFGGAIVANVQVSLDKARTGLALARDDRDRLLIQPSLAFACRTQ